jgi:hypothetical protein
MGIKINLTIGMPSWLDRICAWPVMWYRQKRYGYSFRRIYLDEGQWTIVDPQDYYSFGGFKWCVMGRKGRFYAVRGVKISPEEIKMVRLHRAIMKAPEDKLVDHGNRNTLDNRRANLRLATYSQNSCNCRRNKTKTSSRFRGVCFHKRDGCWTARIHYEGKAKWLGRFDSELEAAKAYDEAAKKCHGEYASLNFPM